MRGRTKGRVVALVATWTLMHAVPAAMAVEATALPGDLVVLEQKMAALRFNSERVSVQAELESSTPLFGPGTPPLVFLIAGEGDVSLSPAQMSVTVGGLGGRHEVREVGGVTYTYEPTAAELDGGRPWVREIGKGSGLKAVGLAEPVADSAGQFGTMIADFNAGVVSESGPAIVDDQPVTAFTATVGPLAFASWERLLGRESPGTSSDEQIKSARLELFITPSGLPLRTRVSVQARTVKVTVTTDIKALEVSFHVIAPSADKTISKARLDELRQRESKHQRLSICRRLPPKDAARCRKNARSSSAKSKQ